MVMNRTIQVRMTKDVYEQIKARTVAQGFESLSDFLRYKALHQDDLLQQRVKEIHEHLLRPPASPSKRRYKTNPISKEAQPIRN